VVLNTAINSHSDLFVSQDVTLSIGTDGLWRRNQSGRCNRGMQEPAMFISAITTSTFASSTCWAMCKLVCKQPQAVDDEMRLYGLFGL